MAVWVMFLSSLAARENQISAFCSQWLSSFETRANARSSG
jgi:hypothetical protein